MEMSIKDTKMHLYMQESYAIGKDYLALENALDIINKYQKIEEIVKNTQLLCNYGSAFIDIREVVEDR